MSPWKPAKYKTDYTSAVLHSQNKPEDCFPVWDRGPDASTYVAVVIKVLSHDATSFTFDVWDRKSGSLTLANMKLALPYVEKDPYFYGHPSTVEAWMEKKTDGESCVLFLSNIAVAALGIPDSAHFLSEGKWPRSLGGASVHAFSILVDLVSKNPALAKKLAPADRLFLKQNFPQYFLGLK